MVGVVCIVSLPILFAVKYGAWVLFATAGLIAIGAFVYASGKRMERNELRGPSRRVGNVELGPLRPGVVPHNGKHCDTDGSCPYHDPTDHHMRGWPMYHGARVRLTVRECPHGVLHPDPDDQRWGPRIHECDDCCRTP